LIDHNHELPFNITHHLSSITYHQSPITRSPLPPYLARPAMKSIARLYKDAFSGIPRSIWLLALTQLINRSGSMVVFFLAVYLRDELHFDYWHTGVIMALFGAGSFVGVYVGGKIIDRIGHYPVMLSSLLIGGMMFIVVGQIHNFYWLAAGMFLLSALGEAFRPAGMVAISHYATPENYTRSISLYRLAINLGFSVGPAVGGILASVSYELIFWADGITCMLAALSIFLFLENTKKKEKKAGKVTEKPQANPADSPFRDKAYLVFIPLVCIYATAFFQLFTTMSLYYKDSEQLSESQIGFILALNGLLVAAIEMVLIYKIEKKRSPYFWIFVGALLLLISYVMLLFVHGFVWLIILTVIFSFSEMFAMPFMNTFMNERAAEHNKGQYASLYVMAWSVAQIATPLLATQVMDHHGYNTLWVVLAGFCLVVILLNRWMKNLAQG